MLKLLEILPWLGIQALELLEIVQEVSAKILLFTTMKYTIPVIFHRQMTMMLILLPLAIGVQMFGF